MSLDEIRQQIHSQIQVKDLPEGGKEFIFPAARNPGFASGATVVCLIWTGIIALLLWNRAPLPFLLVFGAIDLLMIAFVFDLWFRRSRVTVNPDGVTVQRAWLAFKKEHRFAIGEIKNIASDVGATAGHAAYHDLKVVGARRKGIHPCQTFEQQARGRLARPGNDCGVETSGSDDLNHQRRRVVASGIFHRSFHQPLRRIGNCF